MAEMWHTHGLQSSNAPETRHGRCAFIEVVSCYTGCGRLPSRRMFLKYTSLTSASLLCLKKGRHMLLHVTILPDLNSIEVPFLATLQQERFMPYPSLLGGCL